MNILHLTGFKQKTMVANDLGRFANYTVVHYGDEKIDWTCEAWIFNLWFSKDEVFKGIEHALMTEKSDKLVLYTNFSKEEIEPLTSRLQKSLSHGLVIVITKE